MVCRPTSSDLEHSPTERTSNNALIACYFWSDVLTFSVVLSAERSEQSLTTSACVTHIHKYMSKPHCVVSARLHCPAKWHAQSSTHAVTCFADGHRTHHRRSCLRACCCHAAKVGPRCCSPLRVGRVMLVRHGREPGVHVEAGPV